MTLTLDDLDFERPADLQATAPPEARGSGRDDVRLLVSSPLGHRHLHFTDLPQVLLPGDLLVVNDSATLPASLTAARADGTAFTLNLSTRYAPDLWLAEPRPDRSTPGPLDVVPGETVDVDGVAVRFVAPFPDVERLWFVRADGDLTDVMRRSGRPIRYAYVPDEHGLDAYQTVFATRPGSAEMPSAARPFSRRVLDDLRARGVDVAAVTLHAGVSSLEADEVLEPGADLDRLALMPEPFDVPAATVERIRSTREVGGRVIAVGTTVVRALESVWDDGSLRAGRGFTRRVVTPSRCTCVVDGLLTGLHDPRATHLAMLYAVAGADLVRDAYREAVDGRYLWHEFGDIHLLLR